MQRPLGAVVVPAAGTIVHVLTAALPNWETGKNFPIHAVMFQALYDNTGKIYIGNRSLVAATYVGCFSVLPIPTVNAIPSYSAALTYAPNALSLNEFWIDAEVSGEGVLVSILQT